MDWHKLPAYSEVVGASIGANRGLRRSYKCHKLIPGNKTVACTGSGSLKVLDMALKNGIPAVAVLSSQGKVVYATRAGELADARSMGDEGIYAFFARVSVPAKLH
jgi:hypothetical protein